MSDTKFREDRVSNAVSGNVKTVYIATVTHGCGTNGYAGWTRDDVMKQVADWCRHWWQFEGLDSDIPLEDEKVVETYFDKCWEEGVIFCEADIEETA